MLVRHGQFLSRWQKLRDRKTQVSCVRILNKQHSQNAWRVLILFQVHGSQVKLNVSF